MRSPTALAAAAALLLAACAAPIPSRDPVGESFPAVEGKSLEGEPRALPRDLAGAVARFTGTELPQDARVFLLDREGEVVWFHDRGYSAGVQLELLEAAGLLGGDDDLAFHLTRGVPDRPSLLLHGACAIGIAWE